MHVSYTNLNLGMQMTRYIRLVILPANVVHTQCLLLFHLYTKCIHSFLVVRPIPPSKDLTMKYYGRIPQKNFGIKKKGE